MRGEGGGGPPLSGRKRERRGGGHSTRLVRYGRERGEGAAGFFSFFLGGGGRGEEETRARRAKRNARKNVHAQPMLVSLAAHSLSAATLVAVSDGEGSTFGLT